MSVAEMVYKTGLLMIASAVVCMLGADVILWLTGSQTISVWLRQNPMWYWYPAMLLVVNQVWLSVHLFGHF